MKLLANFRMSFYNLISSKLRSSLAILGIVVGTGSVVALISSSQLATQHALAQFKTLGTNLISVTLEKRNSGSKDTQYQRLTLSDIPKLRDSSPEILSIAPYTSTYQSFGMSFLNTSGQVLGVTGELKDIAKLHLAKGRFISYFDKQNFFCVVGHNLAQKIRQHSPKVIGQQIKVGNQVFTIVGIMKPWTPSLLFYASIDDDVIVPLRTSYVFGNSVEIDSLLVRIAPGTPIKGVQMQLQTLLKRMVPDFRIRFHNPQQIIETVAAQRKTFTWLLAAIGGISLLVGGIGVMNIMLVSVVERRREIGIRMAVGAFRIDILRMFLNEGVMLTLVGGFVGVVLGVGVSYGIALASGWDFMIFWAPPALGFIVSVLVGLVSGFYPAYRASRLDPIQTLQAE